MPAMKTDTISTLRTQAAADWRAWARALADSGKLPPTRDLVDAAGLLGRTVDDLERDSAYLKALAAEEAVRDQWKAAFDRVEAERGDLDEINAQIEQLEGDLEELRKRLGWGALEGYSWGAARSKCDRLRKQRPDLFEAEA